MPRPYKFRTNRTTQWEPMSGRLHARLLDDRSSRRCLDEIDQRLRRLWFLRSDVKATGEYGEVLDICWQRSEIVDARHRQKLADLLESDLRLPSRYHLADRHSWRTLLDLR